MADALFVINCIARDECTGAAFHSP